MIQTVTLPMPPSANRMWVTNRRTGTKFRTPEYLTFVKLAQMEALQTGLQPVAGPVEVTLHIYRARRSGDIDNRIKCTLDALNRYAYFDDGQITDLHVHLRDDPGNPRVEVTIKASSYVPPPPRRRSTSRKNKPVTLPLF